MNAAKVSYAAALEALPPALRPLVASIVPAVAAYMREQVEDDPFEDVCKAVPRSRRAIQRACRAGEIPGATKTGRTWIARKSAIAEWLGAQRKSSSAQLADSDASDEFFREALRPRRVSGGSK